MSIAALLLGLLNIAIVAVLLVLLGLFVVTTCKWFSYELDPRMQKFYVLLILLIALYMLVALMFGLPTISFVSGLGLRVR